jgi:hypothetical protein
MQQFSAQYLSNATMWLFITTLAYFLMNGAQIFETAVLVPKWTAAPPESFQLFKGKHGLDFKPFWIALHSIHEVTFMIAIYYCWNIEHIRNWLCILFLFHFAVRIWTLAYFAPNIIAFQQMANNNNFTDNIVRKTTLWRRLNYLRVGVFIAISIGLIPLCIEIIKIKP